ncbi:CBS domain-containing protein [Halobellus captivus]|uniref:CBS domain-containing protein n=1 Tax=Halobellus captivus TaxID=2592614 RepID=UPI001EF128C6|nr:CBS domain-containing protein [Halobellus captivus]
MSRNQPLAARDLMTTDVETVSAEDDVSEVLGRLARADFNGYPVVDEEERVVGIVTQHDLVGLFQTKDRTLWIPVGFPPFLETLTYAVDISWDDLDLGIDLLRNTNKPIREVMTADVVTVGPDTTIDEILDLLADEERDINRLPVVEDGKLVGIVARQDVIRAIRDERRASGESPEPKVE